MKVAVDPERCQGHGQCNLACPELFLSDDQGFARLATDEVPAGLEARAERAARGCPEGAIALHRNAADDLV